MSSWRCWTGFTFGCCWTWSWRFCRFRSSHWWNHVTFIVVWSDMSFVVIWTWVSWMNYRSIILEGRISLSNILKFNIKLSNNLISFLVFHYYTITCLISNYTYLWQTLSISSGSLEITFSWNALPSLITQPFYSLSIRFSCFFP